MRGIDAFLEVLAAAGVRHIFGNPGTTELPLNDALAGDARFQYVFGLHEIPVLAMADGFAMASGRVGVCNVHIACGLGNSMGMLYNAFCEGTPLILTAGQQDRRLEFEEPVLAADLVRVARPWTKWSAEVRRAADIPSAVRRAIQTALTPPTGPVFLSLPVDVQLEPCSGADLSPPHIPDRRVRPPLDALRRAADLLSAAARPAILAGSRVTESGAAKSLAALAERMGAPVFAESATSHGRLPMPADHPLYAGTLPLWSPDICQVLKSHDVLLVVGMNLLRMYLFHEPVRPLPEGVCIIQLDHDPWQIGKNYAVEVGLIGDPDCGLAELDTLVAHRMSPEAATAASARRAQWSTRHQEQQSRVLSELDREKDQQPMTASTLMHALARVLPSDGAVIEEAVTTHHNLLERLGTLRDPGGHFAHRGWALGWGLGCALGVKLAWPDRPVLGLLGDGAALYGIQGLWTAAHYHIPVTWVVANNAEYRILKVCGQIMPLPRMQQGQYIAMDLVRPGVDFVGLARALGVDAVRLHSPDELSQTVRESLAGTAPRLIEVPTS